MKKVIDDRMDVGMDVGTLLNWFLIDFGTVLRGKLAPSWHQNQKKNNTKTMSKIEWLKIHAGVRGGRPGAARELGSGPLKTFKNTLPNTLQTMKHPQTTQQ